MAYRSPHDPLPPGRLIAFSDGVFAIAVTLLVFNLHVPEIFSGDIHRQLPAAIMAMLPRFITYLVSFLLIAIFWTIHHRMLDQVIHADHTFIWINVLYLLVISFIPFPTAMIGAYPSEAFTYVFYICCMILAVGLSLTMWWYAAWTRRLISKETPTSVIHYYFYRGTATLAVFLFALPLAVYHLHWAQYCLLFIFPMQLAIRKRHKKKTLPTS